MRWQVYKKDKTVWHKWFAWRPVKVDEVWVWGETIERQEIYDKNFGDYICNYRFPEMTNI
jgi:hypothetical protein